SALLLTIYRLGKMGQTLIDPRSRRKHGGVNQFVNEVGAGKLRIFIGHRNDQQRAAFKRRGTRIGQVGDVKGRAWGTEPSAYEFCRRFKRARIGRSSIIMTLQTE